MKVFLEIKFKLYVTVLFNHEKLKVKLKSIKLENINFNNIKDYESTIIK